MAGTGLIPMLFNFLLTLAGKLQIFKGEKGERSDNVENGVQYNAEGEVDSLETTVRRFSKVDTVLSVTYIEMGAGMDVDRSFDHPMKKSIPSFTFSVLPPELIFMITLDLKVSSQACLALVERYLHSVLKNRLKSELLQLPAASFPKKAFSEFFKYRTERWIFLSLLEIDLFPQWGACVHCFKLHPFQQCPSGELTRRSHRRSCAVGTTRRMNRRTQSIYDVCPCIKLTCRGKRKLEKSLLMPAHLIAEGNKEPPESNGSVIGLHRPRKGEFWWHECRKLYGSIEVTTKVRPSLDRFGGILLTTRYEFQDTLRSASLSAGLRCPHPSLHTWVYKFLRCRKREDESMESDFRYHMWPHA